MRAQDWFVVVLELTTVVLGIFIGLQVDSWHDERLDRISEAAYLERLADDLSETLALLRDEHAQLTSWLRDTEALVAALDDEASGREAAQAHRSAFMASTRVLIGRAQLATITELIQGGQLSLIRDPEVRGAVAASEGLTESRRLQLQVLSRQQQVLAEVIRPYYRSAPAPDGSWGEVVFEWREVAGNRPIIRALSQAIENIWVNRLWLEEVLSEMEHLEAILERSR